MKVEYGISFKGKIIREGFSKDQAESFIKAKESDREKVQYKIICRQIGNWK